MYKKKDKTVLEFVWLYATFSSCEITTWFFLRREKVNPKRDFLYEIRKFIRDHFPEVRELQFGGVRSFESTENVLMYQARKRVQILICCAIWNFRQGEQRFTSASNIFSSLFSQLKYQEWWRLQEQLDQQHDFWRLRIVNQKGRRHKNYQRKYQSAQNSRRVIFWFNSESRRKWHRSQGPITKVWRRQRLVYIVALIFFSIELNSL